MKDLPVVVGNHFQTFFSSNLILLWLITTIFQYLSMGSYWNRPGLESRTVPVDLRARYNEPLLSLALYLKRCWRKESINLIFKVQFGCYGLNSGNISAKAHKHSSRSVLMLYLGNWSPHYSPRAGLEYNRETDDVEVRALLGYQKNDICVVQYERVLADVLLLMCTEGQRGGGWNGTHEFDWCGKHSRFMHAFTKPALWT